MYEGWIGARGTHLPEFIEGNGAIVRCIACLERIAYRFGIHEYLERGQQGSEFFHVDGTRAVWIKVQVGSLLFCRPKDR